MGRVYSPFPFLGVYHTKLYNDELPLPDIMDNILKNRVQRMSRTGNAIHTASGSHLGNCMYLLCDGSGVLIWHNSMEQAKEK